MQTNKQQPLKGYFISLVLAMGLNIFPFSSYWKDLNPDWVLLTLIFWVLAIPERIGIFNALAVGLLVDALTGRVLGQHALAYVLIIYVCLVFHRRLRQYLLAQQAFSVFLCLLFSQIIEFMVEGIQGDTKFTLMFWMPVVIGTFFWPVIYALLGAVQIFKQTR